MHPYPIRKLVAPLALAVSAVLACPAQAAGSAEEAAGRKDDRLGTATLDQVVVTGTRTENRKARESAAPITVLEAQDIVDAGKANLLEALQTLLPSFNLPTNIQPDLGSIIRGAQLRNLSPAYTLVLVNGARRNSTAVYAGNYAGDVYVDLSLIPITAIDHIEVLRDGASSLYGADAVAGVINIILKKDAQGGSVSVEGGQAYQGDGSRGIVRANYGFGFGHGGWANLSLESIRQNIAVTTAALAPTYLTYPAINDATGAYQALGTNNALPAGASPNPKEATRDNRPWINQGINPYTLQTFAANFGYDASPGLQFYGFATFAHRKAQSAENFRTAYTVWTSNPGALALYPDGFTPWEAAIENDWTLNAGARGVAAGWDWNFSTTYSRDDVNTYTLHSLNFSLDYPGGPTDFYDGHIGYRQLNNNLDFRRAFDIGWARPLELAFGLEYENDQYRYLPGDPDSYYGVGAASEVGNKPEDQARTGRHNEAAYLGLSSRPTARWELDASARFQKYSDFGGVPNFGLATRFDFTPAFALRGSVSSGFKAPSLVTQSYTNTNDRQGATYAVVRPASAIGQALGATPLRAEKARNYSVGLVWDPADWLDVTVDAYQIDVRDQLGSSPTVGVNTSTGTDANGNVLSAAQIAYVTGRLASFGVDPGIMQTGYFISYLTNVGDLRTRGVDINATAYQRDTALGNFRYTFAANFNTNRLTRQAPLSEALQEFPNISLLGASTINRLLDLAPKRKFIASVGWNLEAWHANLKETLYGPLQRIGTVPYKVGSVAVTDLSLGREFGDHLSIDVGANDLFDTKSDRIPAWATSAATLAQYGYAYDNTGPVSNVGGYYYLRATYTF